MNVTAISFIIIESFLEYYIYKYDISPVMSNNGGFLYWLGSAWICSYFHAFAFYAAASFSDPGYFDFSWSRNVDRADHAIDESDLDDDGTFPFCVHCQIARPLRAHHCSRCRRCVLLMDHHCIFTGNCVGFRNYKSYFVFLWSFLIRVVLNLAELFICLLCETETPQFLLFVLGGVYYIGLGIVVLAQLRDQLVFVTTNRTAIESLPSKTRDEVYARANVPYESRYDIGLWKNLKQRLGDNIFLWFLPFPNSGNPFCYPQNPDHIPIWRLGCDSTNATGLRFSPRRRQPGMDSKHV
jgi:palmitoyltransferase